MGALGSSPELRLHRIDSEKIGGGLSKQLRWAFALVAALLSVLAIALPTPAAAADSTTLTVGTFNIASAGDASEDDLRGLTEQYGIEVVGLQELDKNNGRHDYDMLAIFAGKTYPYHYFSKAIDYSGGEYGIGTASRYALSDSTTTQVDSTGMSEQRVFQRSALVKDGHEIAFYNAHLSYESLSQRHIQMEQLKAVIKDDPAPYKVVVGDFNADQNHHEFDSFLEELDMVNGGDGTWFDTYNEPDSTMKVFSVDNILYTRNMRLDKREMVEKKLSDHNLLYATFTLLDAPRVSYEWLRTQIDAGKELKQGDYTEESWNALQSALKAAETAYANKNLTQPQIDKAARGLSNAIKDMAADDADGGTILDDTSTSWSYSAGDANNGGWTAGGSGDNVSTEHWANQAGATVDIAFNGTGFALYGVKAPAHRYISVQIDDGKAVEVDTYAATRATDQLFFKDQNLSAGDHTAHVKVLDKSNPAATDVLGTSLEYAVVWGTKPDMSKPVTTTVEDSQTTTTDELFKVSYQGADWHGETGYSDLFSNGDDHYSNTIGDSYSLCFIGTGVEIIATKNPAHGTYRVELDGKQVATVNTGDTTSVQHKQSLYKAEGLAEKEHRLVVTLIADASGNENGDSAIQVDALKVTHKPVAATGITVKPSELTLEAGQTRDLTYEIVPSVAVDQGATWTSSDENVVTVDDGTVTAASVKKEATATVTVHAVGTDATAAVKVTVYPKVKDFSAFVGDEKILDIPAEQYEARKSDRTDTWSDTAWRGDERSSRIGVVTTLYKTIKGVKINVGDFKSADGNVISAKDNVDVRWLRTVEADADRGMSGVVKSYPDVIYYPNTGMDVPTRTLAQAWLSLNVPVDAKPGTYTSKVTVSAQNASESYTFTYKLDVLNLVQPTPAEVGYNVQLWQHPFSATGYYYGKSTVDATSKGSGLWGAPIGTDAPISTFMSDEFKSFYRGILTDYAKMGGNDLVANIVDEAWGHQGYYSDKAMVTWTKKSDGTWSYDYTLFDKWVEFAIECGVINPKTNAGKIKCYSMIPWNNQLTYIDETAGGATKKETFEPGSDAWKQMWTPFLNDFMKHLDEKGWFDITYIAFDEREGVDTVCEFIKEHKLNGRALKTAAAINYSPANIGNNSVIDDVSVGQSHVEGHWTMDQWYKFVNDRKAKGLETTLYTCTGDYPTSSQQADPGDNYWSVLYSQKLHTDGYLRWALDSWINDMYGDTSYVNWEPGDAWFIYPLELGADGTFDAQKLKENPSGYYSSPRYEMFKQGVRDVCKIRYLEGFGGDIKTQVSGIIDSLKKPNGADNIPATEADRLLARSESDRVYQGVTEIAKKVASEPTSPEYVNTPLGTSVRFTAGAAKGLDGLRLGYEFRLPAGATWDDVDWERSGWGYGLSKDEAKSDKRHLGISHKAIDGGRCVANIVFTDIPADQYKTPVYAQARLVLKDGREYVSDTVQSDTPYDWAGRVLAEGSGATDAERSLAQAIRDAADGKA